MTEKNYNPNQKENKAIKKQKIASTPKQEKVETSKVEEKKGKSKPEIKEEKKKQIPKIKKDKAFVRGVSLPISTKYSIAICRFVKGKRITDAISDLNQVLEKKKAVPMKGEIPHRKGKGMMSGRYPKKAAEYFIMLLKSLSADSNVNGLDDPVIVEAIANIASRPYGRFGSIKRKRTHVKIIAKEKKLISKNKKLKGNK